VPTQVRTFIPSGDLVPLGIGVSAFLVF